METNNNVLGINFNISEDQLANRILEKVESKITQMVLNCVETRIKKEIEDNLISVVSTKTDEVIRKFVEDIYSNTTLQIPKKRSYYSETAEFESVVLKEYVLKQIQNTLENGNYNSSSEKTSLESYLKRLIETDVVASAKRVVEKEVSEVRKGVDNALKTTFDTATKQALSEQVFNVLMASETYKKVESGIKLLQSNA